MKVVIWHVGHIVDAIKDASALLPVHINSDARVENPKVNAPPPRKEAKDAFEFEKFTQNVVEHANGCPHKNLKTLVATLASRSTCANTASVIVIQINVKKELSKSGHDILLNCRLFKLSPFHVGRQTKSREDGANLNAKEVAAFVAQELNDGRPVLVNLPSPLHMRLGLAVPHAKTQLALANAVVVVESDELLKGWKHICKAKVPKVGNVTLEITHFLMLRRKIFPT